MNAYSELKGLVEALGIPCSALTAPATEATYAIVQMATHQPELSGDDVPVLYGAYMQIDLYTSGDADALAKSIVNAAMAAGYNYRGRSDGYQNDRQHVAMRLIKLEE